MRILDIGAGIEYTNKAGEWHSSASERVFPHVLMQYAQYRWTCRNTAEQVRKLTGTDEWLDIDGIDVEAPHRFTDEAKRLHLDGHDINGIPHRQYSAITWFYPNPWDIIDTNGSGYYQSFYPNPLSTVISAIPKLTKGGRLILETEMVPRPQRWKYKDIKAPPDPYDALKLVLDTLGSLLVPTEDAFATNEPYHSFSRVFAKR